MTLTKPQDSSKVSAAASTPLHFNRRAFLRGLAATGALLGASALGGTQSAFAQARAAAQAAARPNFVFILCDDLRKGALSSEGHPFAKTPHIDRIAREGMTFRNAFVTTPVCSPSRASFLTGQFAHTHGVVKNTRYEELSHRLITWPRLLNQVGYETGYVGKWHMGQDDKPRPGFDHWVSFKGQGEYFNPPLNINGQQVETKGYATDIISDHAVEFVKRPHAKPFALYVGHKAPHGPFVTAERHRTLFEGQRITRAASARATVDLQNKPALGRYTDGPMKDEFILKQLRMMTALDEGVGRLFGALEASGQLDNTVFVFSSDHGYFWGEHGLTEKRFAYDEALRVPLLVRFPRGVKAGSFSDQMVQSIDLAPTFLELGGAPIPAHIQGRSLVPLLRGQAPRDWKTSILAEFQPTEKEPLPAWQAARTSDWKYIRYAGEPKFDELYDLKNDPLETKNRAHDATKAADLKRMQVELQRLLAQTSRQAPAVTPLAAVTAARQP